MSGVRSSSQVSLGFKSLVLWARRCLRVLRWVRLVGSTRIKAFLGVRGFQGLVGDFRRSLGGV